MAYELHEEGTAERCASAVKKSGRLAVAIIGIAVGVILLLIGNHAVEKSEGDDPSLPTDGQRTLSMEEYRTALEERMAFICAQVAGVGEVNVVVSLEGGYEYVYAYDEKYTASGQSTSYIIIGSGSGESLVYLTERVPTITGIGVVCTGGRDSGVRREVTSLLAAAFGVGTNKIYVTERG
jgi:stage III sporulation protein AG